MEKKGKSTIKLLITFVAAGVAMRFLPQLNFLWVSIIVICVLLLFIKK